MTLYIILETILFITLTLYKITKGETWLLHILTFLPVILTSITISITTIKKLHLVKPLYLIIMLAVLGDLCFIYLNNIYGIYFFFLIQLSLLYYLNKPKLTLSYLLSLAILIFLLCYILNNKYLIIEGILYITIFLFNLTTMLKELKFKKGLLLLFTSFLFLSLCDSNVFLIYLFEKLNTNLILINICFILEWLFYIGFQILLTLYTTSIIKKAKNS